MEDELRDAILKYDITIESTESSDECDCARCNAVREWRQYRAKTRDMEQPEHPTIDCARCGESVRESSSVEIEDLDIIVCRSCFANGYSSCHWCGNMNDNDEMVNVVDRGETICETCRDDAAYPIRECETCGDMFQETRTQDDCHYCRSCFIGLPDKYPDNPEIDAEYRSELKTMIVQALPTDKKIPECQYNSRDAHLRDVSKRLGPVVNPVYLYGLTNEHDYDIRITPDLEPFMERAMTNVFMFDTFNVQDESMYKRRVGISENLRSCDRSDILKFLRKLTAAKEAS